MDGDLQNAPSGGPPPPPPGYGPPQAATAPPPPPPGYGPPQAAGTPVGGPGTAQAGPVAPSPQGTDPISALLPNTKGEGTYQLKGKNGQTVQVPYSNVEAARALGYAVQGEDANRYANDYAADPNAPSLLRRAMYTVSQLPGYRTTVGAGKGAERTVGGLLNILADQGQKSAVADHAAKIQAGVIPAGTPLPSDPIQEHLKKAANWLNENSEEHGFWENVGGFGEGLAELLTPEALASLAGDAGKLEKGSELATKGPEAVQTAVSSAEKYADAANVAKTLDKFPRIKALVGIGLAAAAKAGGETALQTYVKTGGDEDAALKAGAEGAVLGGGVPLASGLLGKTVEAVRNAVGPEVRTIEGVDVPVPKGSARPATVEADATAARPVAESRNVNIPVSAAERARVTPAQAAGENAYGAMARNIARPHLENLGIKPEVVDQYLNSTHDMTGAGNKLEEASKAAYDTLDQLTNGRFRQLNEEVKAAGDAQWAGGPDAQAAYQKKLEEMNQLISDATDGQMKGKDVQTIKNGWTQRYVLRDFGKALDQSLEGLPGDSNVSREQRGIRGDVLDSKIKQLVRNYGIDKVKAGLGPGRLENLQLIADATKTNAGRREVNSAVRSVAEYLGTVIGAGAGGKIGSVFGGGWEGAGAGALAGRKAGPATYDAMRRVMFAMRTNPEIGQKLIYAAQKGVSPEKYGPVLAAMITEANTQKPEENPQQ